jgi:hypothetical protein
VPSSLACGTSAEFLVLADAESAALNVINPAIASAAPTSTGFTIRIFSSDLDLHKHQVAIIGTDRSTKRKDDSDVTSGQPTYTIESEAGPADCRVSSTPIAHCTATRATTR